MSMTTNHEHLRQVAEKATPGPWAFSNATGEWVIRDANQKYLGGLMKGTRQLANTAVFIAAFNPATAIALLDELAALRKENEALTKRPVLDSILYEIHRRADKEWADDGYDFTVTISADEYKQLCAEEDSIDAARAAIGDSHE